MCLLLGDLSVTGGNRRSDGSVSCESCVTKVGRGSEGGRYGDGMSGKQANPSSLC